MSILSTTKAAAGPPNNRPSARLMSLLCNAVFCEGQSTLQDMLTDVDRLAYLCTALVNLCVFLAPTAQFSFGRCLQLSKGI